MGLLSRVFGLLVRRIIYSWLVGVVETGEVETQVSDRQRGQCRVQSGLYIGLL